LQELRKLAVSHLNYRQIAQIYPILPPEALKSHDCF